MVHVINGEHPAAMQHGNSSSNSLHTYHRHRNRNSNFFTFHLSKWLLSSPTKMFSTIPTLLYLALSTVMCINFYARWFMLGNHICNDGIWGKRNKLSAVTSIFCPLFWLCAVYTITVEKHELLMALRELFFESAYRMKVELYGADLELSFKSKFMSYCTVALRMKNSWRIVHEGKHFIVRDVCWFRLSRSEFQHFDWALWVEKGCNAIQCARSGNFCILMQFL